MKVAFLGTASALSSGRRGNTSLVVRSASTLLLVECSGNAPAALDRLGLDATKVGHVLISHHHADHLCGLPSLVDQQKIATKGQGRHRLTIHGPAEALDVAGRLLDAVGLLHDVSGPAVVLEALPLEEQTTEVGDLEMTTFPVSHGEVPTLGARIGPRAVLGRAMVYSSDTEPSAAVVRWSGLGAELLVHECTSLGDEPLPGHTCLAQLETLVEGCEAPRVLLTHLPPASRSAEAAARARLERRFGDRVHLAEDFAVVEV